MLGQICYKEFYERPGSDYQEVLYNETLVTNFFQAFIVHARHGSVTFYYCKFPNQYLSEISSFGKKYLNHPQRTFRGKVKLLRTNKYSLRSTSERVQCFRLLAKLLWYLVSGKSKVGYLSNYPDNPLHYLVLSEPSWQF